MAALNEAGIVPTAAELGAVDWFGHRWPWFRYELDGDTREWLDAVAPFQPDWSESIAAAKQIATHGSEMAVRFAREHRAPGFGPAPAPGDAR